MATPLKIKDANGNIQELTTAEENYIAYQIGLHLSEAGASEVGSLNKTATGNNIGSFTDTFFNEPVGTHPSTSITSGSTTTNIYQTTGTAAETDSDVYRPLMWVDSAGSSETGFKMMPDVDLNSAVDRYLSTIFTSEYPGSYRIASSSPGGNWTSIQTAFTDTRTDGTSVSYNIYKKTSGTAPSTVRPMFVEDSAGGSGIKLRAMNDRQIRYSFGQRAKTRILASGIGTYQLRSSAQGAPTAPGTWVAKGVSTDTKQTTSQQLFTRDSTSTFQQNYTRGYTNVYTLPYVKAYTNQYTRTFDSTPYTTTYSGPLYQKDYSRQYLGNYIRNYTSNYITAYDRNYTSTFDRPYTLTYVKAYTPNYVTAYDRNYVSTFDRPYTLTYIKAYTPNYIRNYTSNYVANFDRPYTKTYVRAYTGSYSSFYIRNYTSTFNASYQGTYVRNYTGDYDRNYTTQYLLGNFVANYDTNYVSVTDVGYARNFAAGYVGTTYTGNFVNPTFTSIFTGTVGYQNEFAINYLRHYTRTNVFAVNIQYERANVLSYIRTEYFQRPYDRSYINFYDNIPTFILRYDAIGQGFTPGGNILYDASLFRYNRNYSVNYLGFGYYDRPVTSGPQYLGGFAQPNAFVSYVAPLYFQGSVRTQGIVYQGPNLYSRVFTGIIPVAYARSVYYTVVYVQTYERGSFIAYANYYQRNFAIAGSPFTGPSPGVNVSYVGPRNYTRLVNYIRGNDGYQTPNTQYAALYQQNYVSNYVRNINYIGSYDRTRVTQYTPNYVRNYDSNYVRRYTGNYLRNYQRTYTTIYTTTYLRKYTSSGFATSYEGGTYVRSYDGPTFQRAFGGTYEGPAFNRAYDREVYQGTYTGASYQKEFAAGYAGAVFNAGYDRLVYQGTYDGASYVRNFNTGYVGAVFNAGYDNQVYQGTYDGASYVRNFNRPYTGPTFATDYTSVNYTTAYAKVYSSTYNTQYVGTYTTAFNTPYETDYIADYVSVYDKQYLTDYIGNFEGNFEGETIDATSQTEETYTLYVRIA